MQPPGLVRAGPVSSLRRAFSRRSRGHRIRGGSAGASGPCAGGRHRCMLRLQAANERVIPRDVKWTGLEESAFSAPAPADSSSPGGTKLLLMTGIPGGLPRKRSDDRSSPRATRVPRGSGLGMLRGTNGAALVGVLVVLAAGLTAAADDEASRRLVAAVAHGDAARATLLLRQGADPDAADRSGWTGLHQAAESGDLSLARAFLEAGAGPDLRSRAGDAARRRRAERPPGDRAAAAAARREGIRQVDRRYGVRSALARRRLLRRGGGRGPDAAPAPPLAGHRLRVRLRAGAVLLGRASGRHRRPRPGRRPVGPRLLPHPHGGPVTARRPRPLPVLALLLSISGCGGGGDSPSGPTPTATPPSTRFEYNGVTHVSWWHDEYAYPAASDSRRALAATGAGWGGLLTTWYMERKDSNDVRPSPAARTTTTWCAAPSTRCTRSG